MLDNQLRFRVHVEYAEKKSSLLQATLSQMLSNIGSHRYVSRALLSRVGSSALLDVAVMKDMCPDWLVVVSGFRTISEGLLPVNILAKELPGLDREKSIINGQISDPME